MTRTQLEKLIQTKATILTLWTKTKPNISAEGKRQFPGLTKLTRVNGVTGCDYQKVLDKDRQSKGLEPKAAQPRKWGTRDGKLVRHNGKTYVPILVRSARPVYKIGDQEIPYEKIKAFLRPGSDGPKVVEYDLDNVVGVTFNCDFQEVKDEKAG